MAVVQRGSTTTVSGSATSGSITKPTGTVSGDRVIIKAAFYDDVSYQAVTSTGFTALGHNATGTGNVWITILERICDGSEGASFTVSKAGSAQAFDIECTAWSGTKATGSSTIGPFTVGTGSNPSVTGVTTPSANDLVLLGMTDDAGTPSTPATWAVVSNGIAAARIFSKSFASAGATGSVTVTNSGGFAAVMVAIEPASTAAPAFDFTTPARRRRVLRPRQRTFRSIVPAQVNPPMVTIVGVRARRVLPVRRARTASVVAVQPLPVNPVFVARSVMRQRRVLTIRRRTSQHIPGQVHPPVPQTSRRAMRLPPQRRRTVQHVPGQTHAPIPQSRPVRRTTITLKRARTTSVVTAQVTPPVNPAWVPRPASIARRLLARRRSTSVGPVPVQTTPVSPVFVAQPRSRSRRAFMPRRRSSTAVVPAQAAPVAPTFVPQAQRRRAARLLARRRSTQPYPPIPQATVPQSVAPTRARRLWARARRLLPWTPPDGVAPVIAADSYPERVTVAQHSRVTVAQTSRVTAAQTSQATVDQRSQVTIGQRSRYEIGSR